MSSSIDWLISRAISLIQVDNTAPAMLAANELVDQFPHEPRARRFRAGVRKIDGDYLHAITDVTQAIALGPTDICSFLCRGECLLLNGDPEAAVTDFAMGLRLGELQNDDYFEEVLYFFRAEAFIVLGRKNEALQDLAHLADDFVFWTTHLRTKSELVAECVG